MILLKQNESFLFFINTELRSEPGLCDAGPSPGPLSSLLRAEPGLDPVLM